MNKGYYIYRIHFKVDAMSKFIDLEKLIKGEKNSLAQIRNYFRVSHWAYKLFHSQDGFMHQRMESLPMRISIISPMSLLIISKMATQCWSLAADKAPISCILPMVSLSRTLLV